MELGKNLVVLLVALVAAVIVVVLLPSTDYYPYIKNRGYSSYEPFSIPPMNSGNSTSSGASVLVDGLSNANVGEGSHLVVNSTGSGESLHHLISQAPVYVGGKPEGFESREETPRNLPWGPLRDSEVLDKFSQVHQNGIDGVNGCVSSGLSNSGGYICLTPDLINLLSTRGGNATGRDSQIGAPSSK